MKTSLDSLELVIWYNVFRYWKGNRKLPLLPSDFAWGALCLFFFFLNRYGLLQQINVHIYMLHRKPDISSQYKILQGFQGLLLGFNIFDKKKTFFWIVKFSGWNKNWQGFVLVTCLPSFMADCQMLWLYIFIL